MVEHIKLGKWYDTPIRRIFPCFEEKNGKISYMIEGIMTFLPLTCTVEQFEDMIENGSRVY